MHLTIFVTFTELCPVYPNVSGTGEPRTGHRTPAVTSLATKRERITPLSLGAMLHQTLFLPGYMLVYFQLGVHQDSQTHFHQSCVPSDWPSKHQCLKWLFLPRCRTLPFPLLKCMIDSTNAPGLCVGRFYMRSIKGKGVTVSL